MARQSEGCYSERSPGTHIAVDWMRAMLNTGEDVQSHTNLLIEGTFGGEVKTSPTCLKGHIDF